MPHFPLDSWTKLPGSDNDRFLVFELQKTENGKSLEEMLAFSDFHSRGNVGLGGEESQSRVGGRR